MLEYCNVVIQNCFLGVKTPTALSKCYNVLGWQSFRLLEGKESNENKIVDCLCKCLYSCVVEYQKSQLNSSDLFLNKPPDFCI